MTPTHKQTPKVTPYTPIEVAGIGELLWDIFPSHKRVGGAPANFAFHCRQLGIMAAPVSSVGKDELGESLLQSLSELDVVISHIHRSHDFNTGTVQVTLSPDGKPSYQIAKNTAWDHIPFTPELKTLANSLAAVCFGSLGQRSALSRATIHTFLESMPADSIKIFDVNLRQNDFNRELIEQSLRLATILKLSDEELPILAIYFNLPGNPASQLQSLRTAFDLDLIAYTRGAEGSLLVSARESDDHPGVTCQPVDSVGAGDSFTAAMCTGLLRGWPLSQVNQFANEIAAFVCSQAGATPSLPDHLVRERSHS
ncbi:carbohydrate kinase [Verrucomicrobiaceae bacterium 227]